MKAGFFTTDITPALGMEMPGGFGKNYIEAIHDPLKARAAVFESEGTMIAFAGVDTCEMVSPCIFRSIRQKVEQRAGIPAANIMIAASHTHSGGPATHLLPCEFADAPPLVQEVLRNHSIHADPLYCEWLIAQAVTALCEAHRRREEAALSVGSGKEEGVSFNRRFRMKNGRAYTHPGKGNPDIVCPAGPVDPEVGVLAAWNREGDLLGCIVNFGCHCTTFSGGVSADYVCYLERTVQQVMGRQAAVVFLNGTAGDVTQVDNQNPREPEFGEKWSQRVGIRLGAEAVKVMVTAEKSGDFPLDCASETLTIARRAPSPARVRSCLRRVEKGLRDGRFDTPWHFAKEILILDYLIRKEPAVPVEIQALQAGPALFLANPAEYFAESGLAIKGASPFPYTYIVTLANGDAGYVPPTHAFAPTGGGYETVLNSYTNLDPAADEMIRSASLSLARRLTPGPAPREPQLAAPQPAWDYGALGPELE
ncbi:MAG: hypothetical protein IT210_10005 [Armatimonadetes bacterium]|nr:hypothetical protein [Armatimonadota bacterium]